MEIKMLGPLINRDTVLNACFWLSYFHFAFESNHLCMNTSGSLKNKKKELPASFQCPKYKGAVQKLLVLHAASSNGKKESKLFTTSFTLT